MRFPAIPYVYLLRLILRHWCAAFCATCRAVKVFLGCLRVMFETYFYIMSHPPSHDMHREFFKQFGFST